MKIYARLEDMTGFTDALKAEVKQAAKDNEENTAVLVRDFVSEDGKRKHYKCVGYANKKGNWKNG